jgi:hypothetical protein
MAHGTAIILLRTNVCFTFQKISDANPIGAIIVGSAFGNLVGTAALHTDPRAVAIAIGQTKRRLDAITGRFITGLK